MRDFFYVFVFLWAFSLSQGYAQSLPAMHGVVLDDSLKTPVIGATIVFDAGKHGVTTDSKGRFSIRAEGNAAVVLTISSIGYAPQTLKILPQARQDTVRLFLKQSSMLLGEVVVGGKRETIEVDIDKITIDASRYKGSTAATADNLLRLIPGVSMGQQGEIRIKGDANVQILVDGKPTLMGSKELADWLKSLPVSSVKNVEVHAPSSARFDAERTGGALNIVLQKQLLDGYRGSMNLGGGTRFNHQASGNVQVKKKRLNASFNAGVYTHPNGGTINAERLGVESGGKTYLLSQQGRRTAHDYSVNAGANLTWEVDTTLLLSSKIFTDLFRLRSRNDVTYLNRTNGIVDESFDIRQLRDLDNNGISASFSVDKLYKGRRKLIADALYSYRTETIDNSLSIAEGILPDVDIFNSTKQEAAVQLRWEQPLSKTGKLEFGTKEVVRFSRSTYPLVTQPNSNDNIFFNQYIGALYGIHNTSIGKTRVQYGLRGEYLLNSFRARLEQDYQKSYLNLFPSMAVFRGFTKGGGIRLSYARRTRRPGISYLNTFQDRRDPKNIVVGNTSLKPEFKDVFDVTMTVIKKKTNIVNSLYYRQTRDAILVYVVPQSDNVVVTTYGNAGKELAVGINPSITVELSKLNVNSNFDLSYYKVANRAIGLTNDGFMAGINSSLGYRFNKLWFAEVTGNYETKRILLNGTATGWNTVGMTIQRSVKEKYLITFNARDIFNTSRFKSRFQTDSFIYTNDYRPQVQAFVLSATYRFGKNFSYKEAKGSLKLDDSSEKSNR